LFHFTRSHGFEQRTEQLAPLYWTPSTVEVERIKLYMFQVRLLPLR